jgi:hypothetical protein
MEYKPIRALFQGSEPFLAARVQILIRFKVKCNNCKDTRQRKRLVSGVKDFSKGKNAHLAPFLVTDVELHVVPESLQVLDVLVHQGLFAFQLLSKYKYIKRLPHKIPISSRPGRDRKFWFMWNEIF